MDRFVRTLGYVGGSAIAAMMILVVGEVLSRAATGRSIPGALEIVGMCLALAVFLAFAPSEAADRHIRVALLRDRLRPRRRDLLDLVDAVASLVVVAVLTWAVGADAWRSFAIREVLPGAALEVPVYPARIAAFLGFLAFALQLLRRTLIIARRRRTAAAEPRG